MKLVPELYVRRWSISLLDDAVRSSGNSIDRFYDKELLMNDAFIWKKPYMDKWNKKFAQRFQKRQASIWIRLLYHRTNH